MRVEYVARCLLGYSRAVSLLKQDAPQRWPAADLTGALHARVAFVAWVLEVASVNPTARNISTALWAAAELPASQMSDEPARRYPQPAAPLSAARPRTTL